MADLTITVSQVLGDASQQHQKTKIAGVAITAGQAVYYDDAAGNLKLADANALASSKAVGIALHAAAAGQPCTYQYDGDVTLGAGAAPVVGTIYCVSAGAGGICPWADLVATDRVTILGIGKTGNKLALSIFASEIAHA